MMLKTGANKVDSGADGLYSDDMGRQKTKADQLGDFLDDLTVEELDEQLVRLGRRGMMVYTNRQLLAKEQGFTAPPPDPPRIDSAGPSLAAQASVETLGWLIEQYLQHDKFKSLQFSTRRNYGNNFARINKEAGSIKLSDLDLEILARLHAGWVGANNAQALGRALMTMVRVVTNFGSEILHNTECERLIGVLRK